MNQSSTSSSKELDMSSTLADMPVIDDFSLWEVPAGFSTFGVVQKFDGPLIGTGGKVVYRSREYHWGVGHIASLPDGGTLTVAPGDLNTYSAPGYFLAAYDTAGRWLWGQNFSNVHAALSAGRAELRKHERRSAADPRQS